MVPKRLQAVLCPSLSDVCQGTGEALYDSRYCVVLQLAVPCRAWCFLQSAAWLASLQACLAWEEQWLKHP